MKPPPKAYVKTHWAKERYGMIWVSLKNGRDFPEWDNHEYRKVYLGSFDIHASAPRFIENALDIAHFPYVHMGILGDPKHPEVEDYDVITNPGGEFARQTFVSGSPTQMGLGRGG
jgi:phenylpropionate dioxygenase-like ring-hydroxylating dioxygenase large terminal subunit